jgi:hypothetical protein
MDNNGADGLKLDGLIRRETEVKAVTPWDDEFSEQWPTVTRDRSVAGRRGPKLASSDHSKSRGLCSTLKTGFLCKLLILFWR